MRGNDAMGIDLNSLKPPGFSLSNYKETRTLEPAEWHKNIVRRQHIYWYLIELYPHLRLDDKPIEGALLCGSPSDRLLLHKKLQQENINSGFELTPRDDRNCTDALNFNSIRSLNIEDFDDLNECVKENKYNTKSDRLTAVSEYLDKGIRLYDMPAVINLNVPDEILVKQFMKWVRTEREKYQAKPTPNKVIRISSAKMRRWHDKRVIPYLDLVQWHQLNGNKITKHHIAKIIFPDERDRNPVDMIIKSTELLVKEIYSNMTRYGLYIQGHDL